MLVRLTRLRRAAHDAIVTGGPQCNERLLEGLSPAEVAMLLVEIDRLTERAADMLAAEKA